MVDVPHDFSVGEQVLPAGKNDIQRSEADPTLLTIRGKKGVGNAMLQVRCRMEKAKRGESKSNLVFERVGSEYRLSEVWIPGQDGYCFRVGDH